jgi:DNA-binding response OmpR family regulator
MLFKGFSRTILVIGDNLMARKTVSRNLAYYEYEVLEGSTVDGIELFREKPYDIGLVILDTTAEDPSGEGTLAQLREISPDVQVALCADLSGTERKGGGDKGIVGIVRKPVQINRLLALVRSVLKEDEK